MMPMVVCPSLAVASRRVRPRSHRGEKTEIEFLLSSCSAVEAAGLFRILSQVKKYTDHDLVKKIGGACQRFFFR